MTHFLKVRDVRRVRAFHADLLLGGRVVMEENPCSSELIEPGLDLHEPACCGHRGDVPRLAGTRGALPNRAG